MFGFGKKKNTSSGGVEKLFMDDQLEMARARSKLYARVSHYTSLFEGENYDVNVGDAYFKGLMNDEAVSFGPMQVAGTHHNGEFMWSWHNPSIASKACEQVQALVQATPELKELVNQKKFPCSAEFAENLCQWIAVKGGWLGAYEAPFGETMTFLLLKLTCFDGHSVEPVNNLWCSFCGRTNNQVAKLLAASPSCHVCDSCVNDYFDIMESSKEMSDRQAEFAEIATMPPCIICGERGRRIFSNYGSACHECIEVCHNAIA